MLACGLLGEIVYFLPLRQRILPIVFVGISFVFLQKNAETVTQQIHNCPCKTKTATTGRQPVEELCHNDVFTSYVDPSIIFVIPSI